VNSPGKLPRFKLRLLDPPPSHFLLSTMSDTR
jgi:hypothetical protein